MREHFRGHYEGLYSDRKESRLSELGPHASLRASLKTLRLVDLHAAFVVCVRLRVAKPRVTPVLHAPRHLKRS